MDVKYLELNNGDDDICLIDSATTHTILKNKKYFSCLKMGETNVNTISGSAKLIESSGRATIFLPEGTKIIVNNALFSPKSRRNLLSFKDIRENGYHIETMTETNGEFLLITSIIYGKKCEVEKLPSFSSGLYYAQISAIEIYHLVDQKSTHPDDFIIWHDRLGHLGSIMMRRIIENSHGHSLKNKKVLKANEFSCVACSQGKLIIRPSQVKVGTESPAFLERIHGDICGPVDPPCGPFRYFMVLIDASTRWSHVCLLSTRNLAFARLLGQIIKLRAQFPDFPIKKIRLDNAGEYSSHAFDDYCMSIGITVEHPVAYVHTQNGLAESLIKRLQLIARPLLMRSKLPSSAWGHAILHAATLVRISPTSYHTYSPLQLTFGYEPNISHLRIFGCAVYVPIAPPQRRKLGLQRRLGIYVGYESPSIIKYMEPLTGDLFTARFADCHFDESHFSTLGGDKNQPKKEITWKISLNFLDSRTKECELEVQRIIHLQKIANQLPDAFNDSKRVTKSHIPAENAPIKIDVPEEQITSANESKARLKRGRPLGSKDKNPRKKREIDESTISDKIQPPEEVAPKEPILEENETIENSINFITSRKSWNRKEIIIDNIFAYNIALDIMAEDEDHELRSVDECRGRNDWPKWKDAIQSELDSLAKRKVFGPVVQTPEGVKPVGYKWVFVRKRNEKNEIVRYKARLVAQGFSQRPGFDYDETYSPVVDAITFRYLVSFAVHEKLDMRLMDVVTAYLYGNLENDIYMRISEGFNMPEACKSNPKNIYSIKLQKSLYGLKQSGRMWYNRLNECLTKEGYTNDPICPCVFIKKNGSNFVIIAVYVDDLNLIGTLEEIQNSVEYLKKEFEIKDFGKTKFCLGLQIEHLKGGIFVHQTAYTRKVLKRFYMDKAHTLSTPMVVRSLDPNKDPFRPREENEEILGPEVPYLSAIGALMYLANCTRPDISFAVNLLARFSSSPTRRHWNGIKHIFRYLQGTIDLGLFYSNKSKPELVGYADAGYLSDPHKARSQTGYLFTYGGTAISWRSTKQSLAATSSNHAEIIAIHEASRECVWLRSMTHYIRKNCGLSSGKENPPTILYEDNAACIAQLKGGYIKGDRTKHISPKFFFTHDLQKNSEIDVQQIRSDNNLADLFTKALPTATFEKLVKSIGMQRLKDLK
uniref:Pol n=1 Tax=Coffea arabica TaxID=13443 RepID=A0A1U9WYE0_COFAR|nr:Pol [Coffea arabica]